MIKNNISNALLKAVPKYGKKQESPVAKGKHPTGPSTEQNAPKSLGQGGHVPNAPKSFELQSPKINKHEDVTTTK